MGVHGLEIVGTQHQDHQGERRVDLNALRQPLQTVAAGLVGILPDRTAPVKAVLVHPNIVALGSQRGLHDPGPARLERQAAAGEWNDAPGQRIGVNQDVPHSLPLSEPEPAVPW